MAVPTHDFYRKISDRTEEAGLEAPAVGVQGRDGYWQVSVIVFETAGMARR
jgi:hypothetical protein